MESTRTRLSGLRTSRIALVAAPLVSILAIATQLPVAAAANGCRGGRNVACCTNALRSQDEIWIVGTERLGCPPATGDPSPAFQLRRYDDRQGWQPADIAQFFASPIADQLTFIYVHGARVDSATAIERGWRWYRYLIQEGPDVPPLRLVLYAWPSPPTARPKRDFLIAAARSDIDGYYLGWLISRMPDQAKTSLIGYSLGVRTIFGALHVVGGGRLAGGQLEDQARLHRARVVSWAGAVGNDSLLPGRRFEKAAAHIDQLLVYCNPLDPVLRRYPRIAADEWSPAIGYSGLSIRCLRADLASRVTQKNVSCLLGKTHSFDRYFASCAIISESRRWLLWSSP